MAREDGEGAIDLLGQDHAREFVRHRERGERDFLPGAGTQFRGKPFGVAAQENYFPRTAVAQIAQPARELLRSELLSGGVQKDHGGGWLDFQFAQRRGARIAQLADFDFGVMPDALNVVAHHGASFLATGLAEHDQADFHVLEICSLYGRHPKRAGETPALQESELLALLEQRLAADAQDFGSAADFVMRGVERGLDRFALEIFERARRPTGALAATAASAHNFRKILGEQLGLLREYQRVF